MSDELVVDINAGTKWSDFPDNFRETLIECASASYGLGNGWLVDWERFYEMLEMYGWDMQDLGGFVDNKIRRIVREAVREGEIS